MPSFNEHTGARISSGSHVKGTDKEKFDAGWDKIFGKKEIEDKELVYVPFDAYTAVLHSGCCRADVLEHGTLVSSISQHLLDAKDHSECESCCDSGWVETWGPEGEGSEDCGECKVSIND